MGSGTATGMRSMSCPDIGQGDPGHRISVPLRGKNTVIVLDLSGSVRNREATRDKALDELAEGLSRLQKGAAFNVVCFARHVVPFSSSSTPVTEGNTAAATAFVESLCHNPELLARPGEDPLETGTGTSRLDAGLLAAIQGKADEVLLISDGGLMAREENRGLSRREVLSRLHRTADKQGTAPVIHTVAINPQGSPFLRRLAREFSGEYQE